MAINQDQFKAIMSGRRRDVVARAARIFLRVASLGYELAARVRSALYDHHLLRMHRVNAVVLSVGNLTAGGTGKTPLVVWLTRQLQAKGLRVAILTRGYKATDQTSNIKHQTYNDEPAELATQCPGVPIIISPDRVAGAAEAIREHNAQVLVLDDGFQHRRLARDLDIVTIDATVPFGYGRLLPAGLLREPIVGLQRANAVVLTRCDQVALQTVDDIEATIHGVNPDLLVARSAHALASVEFADGAKTSPARLEGRKVFVFCGIGNPEGFLRTVESCGCRIVGKRIFDDHQVYSSQIMTDLIAQAKSSWADLLLTTQKDWTKVKSVSPPNLAYLTVELAFLADGESLTALIDRTLAGRISPR
jgi:tetraacyldisaccharide 4'-kinase